ncbi:thioesterase family protein [Sphingopyxis granuli]|uniref:acyl-CoA thioesterase n=1 Tax=Sphingopyxis granuli TaxID=267128 RepID=UPI00301D5457
MFSHRHDLIVEWGDCDPAGIVFYPRFFAMFDAATASLLEAASGRPRIRLIEDCRILGWPMVDTSAQFHAPVRFDDRVSIESRVTHVGTASFAIAQRLTRGETLCVEAMEMRVWSIRDEQDGHIRSQPIPAWLRAALGVKA